MCTLLNTSRQKAKVSLYLGCWRHICDFGDKVKKCHLCSPSQLQTHWYGSEIIKGHFEKSIINISTELPVSNHQAHLFLNFFFEYSCFTMLCWFLLYSKVISCMYTYISSFLDFLPIWVTTEHGVELPVLYSRFSLVIYFIHSMNISVYMSIPISQFTPPPLPPQVSTCLFSASVSLFLSCSQALPLFPGRGQLLGTPGNTETKARWDLSNLLTPHT